MSHTAEKTTTKTIIRVKTRRHGELEVPEDKILEFPAGLLGFRDATRFAIMEDDRGLPFKWLQCLDAGDLAFLVAEPAAFFTNYELEIPDEVLESLEIQGEDEVLVLLILTYRQDRKVITANLQGPLVLNSRNQKGRQLVLQVASYSTRYPVVWLDRDPDSPASEERGEAPCSS